jgi:hypothetical protein
MNNRITPHRNRKHLVALVIIVAWSAVASYAGVVIAHLIGH